MITPKNSQSHASAPVAQPAEESASARAPKTPSGPSKAVDTHSADVLPKLMTKLQLANAESHLVRDPTQRPKNHTSAARIKDLLAHRRQEQALRYSGAVETQDAALFEAMAPMPGVHATQYVDTVGTALEAFVADRKNSYKTMALTYGQMSETLITHCDPKYADAHTPMVELPQVKQVRTSLKRDASLVAKDIEMMLAFIDGMMPLSMQIKAGISSAVEGNRDLKNMKAIAKAMYYEETKPTWETPFRRNNQEARADFDRKVARHAEKMTLRLNHPAFTFEVDPAQAGENIEHAEVINELLSERVEEKKVSSFGQQTIVRETVEYKVENVIRYIEAQTSKPVFHPFAIRSATGDGTDMTITSLVQLQFVQNSVSDTIGVAQSFISRTLRGHERLLQRLMDGTGLKAGLAQSVFTTIFQELGTK